MASLNKTLLLGLPQWQANEYPQRVDFVDGNAAIDGFLFNVGTMTEALPYTFTENGNTYSFVFENGFRAVITERDGVFTEVLTAGDVTQTVRYTLTANGAKKEVI